LQGAKILTSFFLSSLVFEVTGWNMMGQGDGPGSCPPASVNYLIYACVGAVLAALMQFAALLTVRQLRQLQSVTQGRSDASKVTWMCPRRWKRHHCVSVVIAAWCCVCVSYLISFLANISVEAEALWAVAAFQIIVQDVIIPFVFASVLAVCSVFFVSLYPQDLVDLLAHMGITPKFEALTLQIESEKQFTQDCIPEVMEKLRAQYEKMGYVDFHDRNKDPFVIEMVDGDGVEYQPARTLDPALPLTVTCLCNTVRQFTAHSAEQTGLGMHLTLSKLLTAKEEPLDLRAAASAAPDAHALQGSQWTAKEEQRESLVLGI